MPIIATAGSSGSFEQVPAGMYQAVCAFVEDIGVQETKFGKSHKAVVCWELSERMTDGRPFMMSKQYTVSLNEKATLRHDLESWRGKAFTESELNGFDIEKLIGANCMLNVISYEKQGGGEGRSIGSISPLVKGLAKIERINAEPPKWIAEQRSKRIDTPSDGNPNPTTPMDSDYADYTNGDTLPF